jgi:hypothetical protein
MFNIIINLGNFSMEIWEIFLGFFQEPSLPKSNQKMLRNEIKYNKHHIRFDI